VTARRLAGEVVSTVEDEGPGFPEDFLARAFEPFARAGDSEGTGLGLAIVSAVAQTHGGRTTAINLPTRGARVTLAFPYFPGHDRAAGQSVTTHEHSGERSTPYVEQSPKT
jgi:signal transduction histidine kinase